MISNINQELVIRFIAFISVLAVMLLWELYSSRKISKGNQWGRMSNNFHLLILNTLIVRFVLPLASAIIFLGVPALAVIAFEVLLIAIALFNRANVYIP